MLINEHSLSVEVGYRGVFASNFPLLLRVFLVETTIRRTGNAAVAESDSKLPSPGERPDQLHTPTDRGRRSSDGGPAETGGGQTSRSEGETDTGCCADYHGQD